MTAVTQIDEYGDIKCPSCGVFIIAPAGYDYQAGQFFCPVCKRFLYLDFETSRCANNILKKAERDFYRDLFLSCRKK
jgi:transposase-like protein